MNRKLAGFFFIGLGIIILLVIIYFLFFYNFNQSTEPVEPATKNNQTATTTKPIEEQPKVLTIKPVTEQELNREEVTRLAASFAERFGSYSNHSNFQNMEDLKLFMTDKMKKWSDEFVASAKLKQAGKTDYYGITTKSVTKKVIEYDDAAGNAKIMVNTQRRETVGASTPNSYNQAVEISLVKDGGIWKVDQAYWQKR